MFLKGLQFALWTRYEVFGSRRFSLRVCEKLGLKLGRE